MSSNTDRRQVLSSVCDILGITKFHSLNFPDNAMDTVPLISVVKSIEDYLKALEINDFNIQVLIHSIGRKEIEEFGIVNLTTILNKFQKGKRKRISGNPNKGIWDEVQINADIILSEGENELLNVNPVDWYSADVAINAGIYYKRRLYYIRL